MYDFLSYLYSFVYPHLYIQCSFCLNMVLKTNIAYLKCNDCKEKDEDKLAESLIMETKPNKN